VEFKHLGSKEVQANSDDQLKKNIVDGIRKMQAIKYSLTSKSGM
jgi:hypothetical protein